MSYLKDLQSTMTEEKKASAKKDIFAFYVGRPLSYLLTIPFLKLNIRPNTVSIIALLEVVLASFVLGNANTMFGEIIGWILFFLWNLLDGVDGNIARLRKSGTPIGSVYDATSGYAAMFLLYFSTGILASKNSLWGSMLIVCGAVSGMAVLFPRLVMHKATNELHGGGTNESSLADKKNFGILKTIALNLTSIAGLVQVLLLFAIIMNQTVLFTFFYMFLNVVVMIVSLIKILGAG